MCSEHRVLFSCLTVALVLYVGFGVVMPILQHELGLPIEPTTLLHRLWQRAHRLNTTLDALLRSPQILPEEVSTPESINVDTVVSSPPPTDYKERRKEE